MEEHTIRAYGPDSSDKSAVKLASIRYKAFENALGNTGGGIVSI